MRGTSGDPSDSQPFAAGVLVLSLHPVLWFSICGSLTQLSSTSLVTVKRATSVLDLRVSVSLAFKSFLRLSAKVCLPL